PRTLGLKACLEAYVAHQREVLTRRTTHRRHRAAHRAHVLEGLLTALDHLDEVIALIRGADSAEDARSQLQERYALTQVQADAILDMQLRRLARLERQKLEDEHRQLQALIIELDGILGDPARLDALFAEELREIRRVHATPRRSVIVAAGITAEDVLAGGSRAGFQAQPVTVYVTAGGYVRAMPQRRTSPAHKHPHDPVVAVLRCTTDHSLLLVDGAGTGHRVDLNDVPVVRTRDRGTHAAQLLGEAPTAPLVAALVLPEPHEHREGLTVVTASAQGQVKRTEVTEFDGRQRSVQAAGLRDGDRLVAAALCGDDDHLLLAHSGGMVIRFAAADVRAMGRTATGVIGMDLPSDATVVSLTVVRDGDGDGEVLTLGADGTVKRSPLSDYPVRGRGGKGLQTGTAPLLFCGAAADLHIGGEQPMVIRPVDVPQARRTAKGRALGAQVGPPVVAEDALP
ncbi:MAG TPA: DNA gyrase C-terminal beta-propeller domain-containing protein, partial [Nitriliruptorales bacterium]|nr:DNA gyrase C-terminal beta-propeller domain-containing protein [Nitriliruptorales bacterium]